MDNEQSVPSLMPVGSDTCTHNVVRGSPSIDLREPKFCGRYISSLQSHHCKIAICLAKLWKTTHNVKHGSSVRINHSTPHVSFIQGIQNVDQTWVKLHLVQTTLNTI